MYAIRVDDQRKLLRLELSGRVTTDEALRAVSQAYALAEAGAIQGVLCDLTPLDRGPAGLLLVAAAVAAGYREGMRLAFVGGAHQARAAERVVRFSGLREGAACFDTAPEAEAWLAPVLVHVRGRSTREEAEEILGRPVVLQGGRRSPRRRVGADPAA